jgi:putative hydrolase of the HAD superfamily
LEYWKRDNTTPKHNGTHPGASSTVWANRLVTDWLQPKGAPAVWSATYELGKLSLREYLNRVVFYKKRSFTFDQFREFMFAQSKPFPEMMALACALKARHGLKIVVVSNEGRELNSHRIKRFRLDLFVDFFICSCFVHFRKPDPDIYRLALDVAQVPASRVLYIEDRPLFIQVAESLGIRGVRHTNCLSTRARLADFGLRLDDDNRSAVE